MNIKTILEKKSREQEESAPILFNIQKEGDRRRLTALIRARKIVHVSDDYDEQLREYFQVMHPPLVYAPDFENKFLLYKKSLQSKRPLWQHGRWVYFQWFSTLAHILEDKQFQTVRTARNRNLITVEEQERFYDAVIGIAGMSVGNSVALAIALQGGGRRMRLADFDRLALSNMNRIRTGVQNLGLEKVYMTTRQIYEINPYAKIECFPEGLTEKNISRFFEGPPKLNIMIDEIDNLAVKYLIRVHARKNRIPIVMAADNADNAVVDIERYDKNRNLSFFHGRMGKITFDGLRSLNKFQIGRLIAKHVGPENTAIRMQESLPQMGKTIVSWPQLGGAAILNGAAVAYCARRIVNNQSLESNRALLSLDEQLIPGFNSSAAKNQRKLHTEKYKKIMGLK